MSLRNIIICILLGVFGTGCTTAADEETRAAVNQRIAARALEVGTTNCQAGSGFDNWKRMRLKHRFDFTAYQGRYWSKKKGRRGGGLDNSSAPNAVHLIDPQEGLLVFPSRHGCIIRLDDVEPLSFGKALNHHAKLYGFDVEEDFVILSSCAPARYKNKKYCENSNIFEHRSYHMSKQINLHAIAFEQGPLKNSVELSFQKSSVRW